MIDRGKKELPGISRFCTIGRSTEGEKGAETLSFFSFFSRAISTASAQQHLFAARADLVTSSPEVSHSAILLSRFAPIEREVASRDFGKTIALSGFVKRKVSNFRLNFLI